MPVPDFLPGPRGLPVIGVLSEFRRDPLGFAERLRDHADITSVGVMGRRGWVLSRPDHADALFVGNHRDVRKDQTTHALHRVLGNGLLVAEGEPWKRHRRLAAPSFTPRAIEGYAAAMSRIAERHAASWRPGVVDVHEAFVGVTRDIVLETVFGTETATEAANAVDVFQAEFIRQVRSLRRILPEWVPTRGRMRIDAAVRDLDRDVAKILADRRAKGLGDDLLSRLMAATDEDGRPAFDDAQLRDEIVTLYLAGHETTALALTYAAWALAQNPDAGARVAREVAELPGPPTLADMARIPYTAAVIDETLRLYPPAWAIGRETTSAVRIGSVEIPAGDTVWVFPWAMHRDPRWWPEPLAFRPERFLEEGARKRPGYLPFGTGPRVCIGSHFARMEAILALATVARRFRFAPVDHAPLRFLAAVTLRPAAGVRLALIPAR